MNLVKSGIVLEAIATHFRFEEEDQVLLGRILGLSRCPYVAGICPTLNSNGINKR